jgi:3-phosphoshikimate 1-carboxyvinyltransferase
MMRREIHPLTKPIKANIRVPGSKSITNRALICAALAKGESVLSNASDSGDTALMRNGLNQLGVLVRKKDETLLVEGNGGRLYAPRFPIPVGNAGTTLRFLISLAALAQGKTVLEGSERMGERPIDDMQKALARLGTQLDVLPQHSRFIVHGGMFIGGATSINVEKSSQFLSSLLMVAPYAKEETIIAVEGRLSSQSYVELTIDVMRRFGIEVTRDTGNTFRVQACRQYKPTEMSIEADATSASYFLAAAAICGGEVIVEGVKQTSLQGDSQFISVLEQMGCEVSEEERGIRLTGNGQIRGIDVDMNSMPDVVPTLAVAALFAQGPSRIRNVAHLRYKESDRLAALETELTKIGGRVKRTDDGLEIIPSDLHGALLDTYEDHRLAMSFALTGLKVPRVEIENPDCVKKSFPTFWREFEKLDRH